MLRHDVSCLLRPLSADFCFSASSQPPRLSFLLDEWATVPLKSPTPARRATTHVRRVPARRAVVTTEPAKREAEIREPVRRAAATRELAKKVDATTEPARRVLPKKVAAIKVPVRRVAAVTEPLKRAVATTELAKKVQSRSSKNRITGVLSRDVA